LPLLRSSSSLPLLRSSLPLLQTSSSLSLQAVPRLDELKHSLHVEELNSVQHLEVLELRAWELLPWPLAPFWELLHWFLASGRGVGPGFSFVPLQGVPLPDENDLRGRTLKLKMLKLRFRSVNRGV
jgi:hypothetical protein